MPKLSKTSADSTDYGPVEEWAAEFDGYAANICIHKHDMDGRPLLKGLPDDRCQCPHWGYVLKGRFTFETSDGEETFHAGDAFYLSAGHIPISNEPGSEWVMFSPAHELHETEEVIMRNFQAMQGAPS
jgi:hypothetical protein